MVFSPLPQRNGILSRPASSAEASAFGARRLEKRCLVPSPVAGKIHFFPYGRKDALFFANDEAATP
jgi:hypothetical protein